MSATREAAVLDTAYASVAYYVPSSANKVLVLAAGYPWPDGTGSPPELRDYVLEDVRRWSAFADRNHVLLVAPAFGSGGFAGYRDLKGSVMSPDVFLNLLIDGPVSERSPGAHGRFYLHGHSAGAQFSGRYLIAHPERLRGAILSAPSTYAMPDPNVVWPYGERKDESTANNQPPPSNWDLVACKVRVDVLVGSEDREIRPPAPGNPAPNRYERGVDWSTAMQRLANEDRCRPTVRFLSAPHLSHDEMAMALPAQKALEALWLDAGPG